ncbi:MAG: hypothetical protein Kow00108_02070 [Calditrichia bacterium]
MSTPDLPDSVPCIQIVGAKNQGKTSLIREILPILKAKGIKVLSFKHSSHLHPVDKPGADSDIFRKAGADVSVFQSGDGTGIYFPSWNDSLVSAVLQSIINHIDLIIVESFSSFSGPKILLHQTQLPQSIPENVIAVIGKVVPQLSESTVLPYDKQVISDFICKTFNLPQ